MKMRIIENSEIVLRLCLCTKITGTQQLKLIWTHFFRGQSSGSRSSAPPLQWNRGCMAGRALEKSLINTEQCQMSNVTDGGIWQLFVFLINPSRAPEARVQSTWRMNSHQLHIIFLQLTKPPMTSSCDTNDLQPRYIVRHAKMEICLGFTQLHMWSFTCLASQKHKSRFWAQLLLHVR